MPHPAGFEQLLGRPGDDRPGLDGLSGVGFAAVRIPGVGVEDIIRPATDLLDRTGPSSIAHRLTLLFSRLRSNQSEPVRTDEENALRRAVTLPTARSFLYGAQARISAGIEDWRIDALLEMPDASDGTARGLFPIPANYLLAAVAPQDSARDINVVTHIFRDVFV